MTQIKPRNQCSSASKFGSTVSTHSFSTAQSPDQVVGHFRLLHQLLRGGAMLYEMVTGRMPFSDYDEQSILSQHLSESVVPPSHTRRDVSPALESIILRLLAKKPQDRFASAQRVCQALDEIVVSSEHTGARNDLPPLSTNFVGRENEITQTKQLLESSRLVTLLGAGAVARHSSRSQPA